MNSSKVIPLTQGQIAIVDAEDYDFLMQWKWYADWKHGIKGYYAARKSRVGEFDRETTVLMHRVIAKAPRGMDCDHRNLNSLDNRKENLRVATRSQNNANRRKHKQNRSGFKGVGYHANTSDKVWEARIKVNGRLRYLGSYSNPEDAHAAYLKAATETFGEFARG